MLGVGAATAALDANMVVTNCRRLKIIRFPRETQIAVESSMRFPTHDRYRIGKDSFYYSILPETNRLMIDSC